MFHPLDTQKEKLDAKYKMDNITDIIWRISIPADKIFKYFYWDSSFIPFTDTDKLSDYKPTEEQIAMAKSFLEELTK